MSRGRQLANCLGAPEPVRLPNQAWIAFLSGPLTKDDWALINRVEAGEISVDDAMAHQSLVGVPS